MDKTPEGAVPSGRGLRRCHSKGRSHAVLKEKANLKLKSETVGASEMAR